MKFLAGLGIFGFVAYLGMIVAAIVGWFMNIFAIMHTMHGAFDGMFVLRIVGIFVAPLGAILGLFF